MALPIEKSKRVTQLEAQVMLIYGRPKIGKSTLASNFEDALFIATEAGLNHLEVFRVNVNSWEKFLEVCADLGKTDRFKTIVIDTVDNLVSYCTEYVCNREKINHPSEYDYGKGWSMVHQEFKRVLSKVTKLGRGVVFIGHSKAEEVKTKTKSYTHETITVTGENRREILNMCDLILFVDKESDGDEERRVIRTKPSLYYEAGDRTGLLPDVLPLSYEAIIKHLNKEA